MNKTKTVRPSTNKWVMLTSAGIISAVAGLGVFASCDQQTLDSNNIASAILSSPESVATSIIPEVVKAEKEEGANPTTAAVSVQTPAMPTDTSAQQQVSQQKGEDKYPVDEEYLKNAKPWSMAIQYKDYVVLSPASAAIWKEKAEKLKKMAEKEPYKGISTYWQGYLYSHQVTADRVYKICSEALSNSRTRIFWNVLFESRSHFNLLWDICGKEDKEKPSTW